MAYDDTSFYGDLVYDEYDDKGNFINPPTSAGFYIYHILGDGFDIMSDMCTDFLNDFSILTASTKGLDNLWGVNYNLPRPVINEGQEDERLLTDEEYRIYLYLHTCRLMTREDIEINMNKCFAVNDKLIYFSTETNYLYTVSHTSYDGRETITSNLAKQVDDESLDFIIDYDDNEEDTFLIESGLSEVEEVVEVVNVPFNNCAPSFLELLESFISVKGNLKIKEYLV